MADFLIKFTPDVFTKTPFEKVTLPVLKSVLSEIKDIIPNDLEVYLCGSSSVLYDGDLDVKPKDIDLLIIYNDNSFESLCFWVKKFMKIGIKYNVLVDCFGSENKIVVDDYNYSCYRFINKYHIKYKGKTTYINKKLKGVSTKSGFIYYSSPGRCKVFLEKYFKKIKSGEFNPLTLHKLINSLDIS